MKKLGIQTTFGKSLKIFVTLFQGLYQVKYPYSAQS